MRAKREIEPIDAQFLRPDEAAEYERLRELPGISKVVGVAFGASALVVVAGFCGFAFRDFVRDAGEAEAFARLVVTPAVWIGLVFLAFWAIARTFSQIDRSKTQRDEAISKFRHRIRYDARVRKSKAPRDSSDNETDPRPNWMTGSYDPTRYYSYSRSERDYMRITGIDADTYDSNVEGRE